MVMMKVMVGDDDGDKEEKEEEEEEDKDSNSNAFPYIHSFLSTYHLKIRLRNRVVAREMGQGVRM